MTALLGWCAVLNSAMLALFTLIMLVDRGYIAAFHARLLGLPQERIKNQYFSFLATYKLFVLVFNIVPYAALKWLM